MFLDEKFYIGAILALINANKHRESVRAAVDAENCINFFLMAHWGYYGQGEPPVEIPCWANEPEEESRVFSERAIAWAVAYAESHGPFKT